MNLYCDHEVWSNDNGRPYRPSLQDLQQTRMEILRRLNRDRFMEANSRPISICTMSSSNDEFPEELDNASLKAELLRKNETIEFQEIFDVRRRLPVIKQCRDILRAIGGHQVTLIVGSTGCGKTTQIPQMVLDDFIFNNCGTECRIACVELVKSNAILAAERVAHERLESVGNSIGLQVGGRM